MVVVYYACSHFLDAILETIRSIKDKVELHVVIEITPDSKKTTIIDIEDLKPYDYLEPCDKVLGSENWDNIKFYFDGVSSVQFLIHKQNESLSYSSFKTASALGKYIKKIKADVVHFDILTLRTIGLFPYLISKKVFITVHDPIPHSGVHLPLKNRLLYRFFFPFAKGFFFYSNFACEQFKTKFKYVRGSKNVIRFQPFSYITQFLRKEDLGDNTILFFGRLTYYKGIDILLEAIPKVLEKFPNEKFVIAGKSYGYELDNKVIEQFKDNIVLITRFLSVSDMIKLIGNAKFIVCPYRDATQSGVLMTSFSFGKTVIATKVGAFPEYISDNVNGFLTEPNADAISNKIIEALSENKYKQVAKNLETSYSAKTGLYNQMCILNAYSCVS